MAQIEIKKKLTNFLQAAMFIATGQIIRCGIVRENPLYRYKGYVIEIEPVELF